MANAKVRPNSRVGIVMKAMLDAGEVVYVHHAVRPLWMPPVAVPCRVGDVSDWASRRGLELRPHDIVELRACIFGISLDDNWTEPFWLPELHLARGRWS